MILPDFEIRRLCISERLVEPCDLALINPASLNLRLSNRFINLHTGSEFEAEKILIKPRDAILASSLEYVRIPVYCAAQIALRSTLAREGLNHSLAGFVDPGFEGDLTFELHSIRPVELYAGQEIAQLVLTRMMECPEFPYQGKYNKQRGPTKARRDRR